MSTSKNLHEMLRDAPVLNETDSAIHSGTNPPTSGSQPATLPVTGNEADSSQIFNLPSPTQNGDASFSAASKIESIKNWSVSTYKCTRQLMYEKLGKTSRTVDVELESKIEQLRDTQRKYMNLLRLTRNLTSHFYQIIQTQHNLDEAFSDLAQKSPELQKEFVYNADTQRTLCKNGEMLLNALNFFYSSVHTLCSKTIEDTLLTVRQFEAARVEYDAYRTDLEWIAQTPRSEVNLTKAEYLQVLYQKHKEEYERLREDVFVKLKFLDENRMKVMHQQLLLFHSAIAAYFSGNHEALEATMKQFCIKNNKITKPFLSSWLEQ